MEIRQKTKSVLPAPITQKSFEKMVSRWGRVFRFRESGSVYCTSKAEILRRLNQLFESPSLLKRHFGERDNIRVFDLETECLEEEEEMGKILKEGKGRILFLLGADKILEEKNTFFLEKLNLFTAFNAPCSVLLFFNVDFTHPSFLPVVKNSPVFFQNIIFHPLYSPADTRQFFNYLSAKWNLRIRKAVEKEILKNCGGRFYLIKQAVRLLRDNPSFAPAEIFSHPDFLLRVKMIWEKFLPSERSVLEKIVRGEENFDSWEKHSFEFLKRVGWLKKVNTGWQITVPLLEKFIGEELGKVDFGIKDGNIYLNRVLVERYFSLRERHFLKLLIKEKGKVVKRETVAEAVWGENWLELYSDWALDQIVSRLRKKLKGLGVNPSLLKTVKKKGFRLLLC